MSKNNLIKVLVSIAIVLFAISCTSLFSDELVGDTVIAIISDVHVSNDESKDNRLKEFVNLINNNKIKADIIVITGDCVSSVYKDRTQNRNDERNNRLQRFYNILSQSKVPFFPVMGNHEHKIDKNKDSDAPFTKLEIDTVEAIWKNITGLNPDYTSDNGQWKFIFMNSMHGIYQNRRFDDNQIKWLNKELQTDRPVLIFFHHPIDTDNWRIWCKPKDLITMEKEPELFNLLEVNKSNIKGIFVGHGHMWVSDKLFEEIKVFETDSFGDAENLTFSLLGLNSANAEISVVKYDDIPVKELVTK